MAVSGELQPLDGSLPHEFTSKTPFPSLKLYFLIGILSLCALSIALLIYLCVRLSRTSKKRRPLAKETNSRASSGPSYEVFLSFRGPDTRHGFTDCLYHDMVDAGILVFRDDESLRVGNRISDELLQAIENSKIYISIFSKNYAASHWCLEELAYMVECTSNSNGNKEILPIFLDVEPDDVKLKTKSYREALLKHRKMFCTDAVCSWEMALIEVANIKGWNWKKDNDGQGDLIRSVIRKVSVKLKVAYENVTEHLVGVDDCVETIMKKLDVGFDGVRFLRIHGMGGVGKTTLAKVVFNKLSSSFDRCCFLPDVRESSKGNDGPLNLQKQLLSKLLGSHSIDQIYHVNDGINMLDRGVLRVKKVLIILDDVDEKEQLKSLAEKGDWFGSGSRIIITTRDKRVLTKGPNVSTYEACEMEFDDALKLFSRHAFRRDYPLDHRVSLSEKIVHTLGKLPLALEITGSSLIGKSEELWIDTWDKLKAAPPMEVQRKLMISYERLDLAQREIFLDIACFFVNKDKTYPFYMWDDCKYHPHVAIDVLVLMSLIKIKDNNTFWMHDQVRDLGREIVHQENFKHLSERSRVWNNEEALSILKRKEGSQKIEALSVGYHGNEVVTLKHDEFANLRNLRFFGGNGLSFVGDFNNLLSNLRWLSWHGSYSKFETTNFHPTNLVVLNLSHSSISEEWIGWDQIKDARKLKVLDLSCCKSLKRTPDFSPWVSLEKLVLEGCYNLIEIDPSIGKLKQLTSLNLDGCESLRELPEEIGCLQALTKIVMPNTLHELPKTFGNLKSLLTFDVPNRQIRKLPYSIGGLVKIRRLDLSLCIYIKELPDSVGKLQSLVKLDLSSTSIDHLPDSIGNLKQLKVLRMSDIRGITKLPSAIGLVEKLEELDAQGCCNLTGEIPKEIGRLSHLRILNLLGTPISGLPTTVSDLSNLQTLKIGKYPELPPNLPTSIFVLSALETLSLPYVNVQCLPQLPSSLRELQLHHLGTTQSPDFSNLTNLSILIFYGCSLEFSSIFNAESEKLYMEYCEFRKQDATPLQLEMKRLRVLKIRCCEFLPEILDLSRMKNLSEVSLTHCHLVEIRGLEKLGSLGSLSVVYCPSLERISDLSKLKKLRKLVVVNCRELKSVQGLNHLGPLTKRRIHDNGEFRGDTSNAATASAVVSKSPIGGSDSSSASSELRSAASFGVSPPPPPPHPPSPLGAPSAMVGICRHQVSQQNLHRR